MDKKKLWNIAKPVLKVLITGLLLYFVFKKIPLKEVQEVFYKCNPLYIVFALLVFFISQIVSSWRLRTYFSAKGLELSFWFNFRLYLLGMFYNLFLPGGIGGDGYKIYLLRKKYKISGKKLLSAIFLDRLSGLWAIGLITLTLIYFIPRIDIPRSWPTTAFIAGSIGYYLVLRRFFFIKTYTFFTAHVKAVMVQSLQVVSIILILLGLDFTGKFSPYLFTFLASSLVAIFPFTVGGLGAREYVFTHASEYFSMDQPTAVFISLSFYIISALVSLIGVYFVFRSSEFEPLPAEEEMREAELSDEESTT